MSKLIKFFLLTFLICGCKSLINTANVQSSDIYTNNINFRIAISEDKSKIDDDIHKYGYCFLC